MGRLLAASGYRVSRLTYPSTRYPIEELVQHYLAREVASQLGNGIRKLHFVTHSMGGILVRQLLSTFVPDELGQVVMLAPPNRGSELVDKLGSNPLFGFLNGPAGRQLGTHEDSLPNRLGPVNYPVGVIAGNRSINPFLSMLIPGVNDGKVSVERTRVEGMKDFIELPLAHPTIMRSSETIEQTRHFLESGGFKPTPRAVA